ncbi:MULTISPECIES: hypothetical protein [Brevundimonas]|jgi:CheY-like chemotaxis protein|uniref:CheY-like chemotaxis protein n=1 Tax=Brevundimonas bullata TaxID=13160 RepID=A0A7W7IRB6_9CAUL|nr:MULTISPECIES: hypothetical protein [Brevundimonas]MBB4799072.1 CheY-like chemotaxis protein [Brevundimonas bullata]MBB6384233.1 CheY-like chemotaxis protein [Brevundimonas bullata]
MNALTQLAARSRVTVIDDDADGRDDLMDQLRDCDFEPSAVIGHFGQDIDRLLGEVTAQAPDFVICDHKLQPQNMASFHGLEVVRRLVEAKTAAMLLTMYQSTDRLELRAHRHVVPIIMGRDAFDPDYLGTYANVCFREIAEDPVDERRPHRTLIRVDWIDAATQNIDAVVTHWSPDHAVTLPRSCIQPSILPKLTPGSYLLGDVNIGAKSEDDLFFTNVNELVDPQSIHDLA